MSTYTIEVDDEKLDEQVKRVILAMFQKEMGSQYTDAGKLICQAVKDIVYSHKDEIIDKVVERASREIVKKGLPKLLEKMEAEHDSK